MYYGVKSVKSSTVALSTPQFIFKRATYEYDEVGGEKDELDHAAPESLHLDKL